MFLWIGFSVGHDSSEGRERQGGKRKIQLVLLSLPRELEQLFNEL